MGSNFKVAHKVQTRTRIRERSHTEESLSVESVGRHWNGARPARRAAPRAGRGEGGRRKEEEAGGESHRHGQERWHGGDMSCGMGGKWCGD